MEPDALRWAALRVSARRGVPGFPLFFVRALTAPRPYPLPLPPSRRLLHPSSYLSCSKHRAQTSAAALRCAGKQVREEEARGPVQKLGKVLLRAALENARGALAAPRSWC